MMHHSVTFSPIQVTFPAHRRAGLLRAASLQYNALDEIYLPRFQSLPEFRDSRLAPDLMTESSSPNPTQFKAEMPQIPGVNDGSARRRKRNPLLPLVIALLVMGLLVLVAVRWFGHHKPIDPVTPNKPRRSMFLRRRPILAHPCHEPRKPIHPLG